MAAERGDEQGLKDPTSQVGGFADDPGPGVKPADITDEFLEELRQEAHMPAGDHTWLWNNKIVTIWAYRVAKLIRHVMDEQAADNVTVRGRLGA